MADNNGSFQPRYAVVRFKIDNTYSEIPTSWIIEDNLCWWPPRTANSAIFISNCTDPNRSTWKQYNIDIIKYCSTYGLKFLLN